MKLSVFGSKLVQRLRMQVDSMTITLGSTEVEGDEGTLWLYSLICLPYLFVGCILTLGSVDRRTVRGRIAAESDIHVSNVLFLPVVLPSCTCRFSSHLCH